MKILKILLVLVLVIVLALAGLIAFALYSIDTIAKQAVERGSTYALDVPTTLDSADVGVFAGTFDMRGLTVSNPQGFSAPHFLALSEGGVSVAVDSLQSDLIELPTLTLTGIDVHLQREGGKANYQTIIDNLKRFESGSKTPPDPDSPSASKKFVIRRVEIRDVNVHAQLLPLGGSATTADVNIPEIVLTDIGSGGEPVSVSQLIGIVTKAILSSAAQLGGGLIPADIASELTSGLSGLTSLSDLGVNVAADLSDAVGEMHKGLEEGAQKAIEGAQEDVKKAVDDAAEKAKEGLKDLLPGKGDGGN